MWCNLAPVSGSDVFGPDAVESRVQHRIALRRTSIVAAGMRVAIGARSFTVHAVLDEGPQAATMTLLCEELP